MRTKERLRVALLCVPTTGVPRASALKLLEPCDGVIAIHVVAFDSAVIERGKHMHASARVVFVDIPLIKSRPSIWQHRGGGVVFFLNYHGRFLWFRMREKVRTDKFSVPRPFVFRVGSRMNASKSAASMHEFLKGSFLRGIENVPCGGEEHDRLVSGEIFCGEDRCILRRIDFISCAEEFANARDPSGDRVVSKTSRL